PDFRMAGAEEACQQLAAALQQVIDHYTPLALELTTRADEAFAQLQAMLTPGRRRLSPAEVAERLQLYPKGRLQALGVRHVAALCTDLKGRLHDQLREVDFCRQRLGELRRVFEQPESGPAAADEELLLPPGCDSVEEAAEQVLALVTPDDLRALDRRLQ